MPDTSCFRGNIKARERNKIGDEFLIHRSIEKLIMSI